MSKHWLYEYLHYSYWTKLEAIQIFINRLMDKIVINPHNSILLYDEKELFIDKSTMGDSHIYYAEWKKSVTKKYICIFLFT
jgi:hypothetical protein